MVDLAAEKLTDKESLFTDGMMTVPEASNFSKLSRSFLYAAMDAQLLNYVACGRTRRIPKRELVRYLASNLRRT